MRRSICYSEPSVALAGEVNTWKFIYTTATKLPKGTRLKFDLMSQGRPIDWESPETNLRKTANVIYLRVDDGKPIPAKEVEVPERYEPQYEFTLLDAVAAGSNISIIIGSPKDKENTFVKSGTQAQLTSQRRRSFLLYIDVTGKGRFAEPEVFHMDIKGNELKTIKILAPSFVVKNRRFDVIIRFEDEYGNLTNNAPEDTLIELSYENIRDNLNWKLFVPETGFLTVPNLYFNEEGVFTIKLRDTFTKKDYFSSPIRSFADNDKHLYWGLLHGESERYDSTENVESCLRHMRDEKGLHFYGLSPFESAEETSNEIWKACVQNAIEFDEADRFSTIIGCQWSGKGGDEGVRQFIYTKEAKQIIRKKEAKYGTLSKIYKTFSPKDLISIPSFTMGKGHHFNFKNFDPEFERVVEIYNAWGSSECSKKEGNLTAINGNGKNGVKETGEGSIQQALLQNCRFGFVAGGLDDRGIYSNFFDSDQDQFHPGLTAIICKEHTRTALTDAIYRRSCYATTGKRIILGFNIANVGMGQEISTADKHGLLFNRHISGYVAGSAPLAKVEIIRNNEVIKTFESDTYHLDFTYDDFDPLEKVLIDAKDKKPPFVYYYLRVTQADGQMAWASPIWIDFEPRKILPKPVAKKPVKPIIKEEILDFNVDEDEEEDEEEDDLV